MAIKHVRRRCAVVYRRYVSESTIMSKRAKSLIAALASIGLEGALPRLRGGGKVVTVDLGVRLVKLARTEMNRWPENKRSARQSRRM